MSAEIDQRAGRYTQLTIGQADPGHHVYRPHDTHLSSQYLTRVIYKLGLPRDSICLDIGGGTGEIAAVLQKVFGAWVIVSDLVAHELDGHCVDRVVSAEATAQPFSRESFGFIHAKDMLVHVASKPSFLAEIWRLLKPSSTAVITFVEYIHSIMMLYYDQSGNREIAIPITDADHYHTICSRLKAGDSDFDVLPNLHTEKERLGIPTTQPISSFSPPYYRTTYDELRVAAQHQGFIVLGPIYYIPYSDESDWYDQRRCVAVLTKPANSK